MTSNYSEFKIQFLWSVGSIPTSSTNKPKKGGKASEFHKRSSLLFLKQGDVFPFFGFQSDF